MGIPGAASKCKLLIKPSNEAQQTIPTAGYRPQRGAYRSEAEPSSQPLPWSEKARHCTTVRCPITGASIAYALLRVRSQGTVRIASHLESAGIGGIRRRLRDGSCLRDAERRRKLQPKSCLASCVTADMSLCNSLWCGWSRGRLVVHIRTFTAQWTRDPRPTGSFWKISRPTNAPKHHEGPLSKRT